MPVKQGTDNIRSKLTKDEVMEIYDDQTRSQVQLAAAYGVSQSAINHIKRGNTWKWLTKHR